MASSLFCDGTAWSVCGYDMISEHNLKARRPALTSLFGIWMISTGVRGPLQKRPRTDPYQAGGPETPAELAPELGG
jgi:hypothetical protein